MEKGERQNVYKVYDKIAHWYSQNRASNLIEKKYLDYVLDNIPAKGTILDLGCGTGKPILEYLISRNMTVIGVDASAEILEIAKTSFPSTEFYLQDMRFLELNSKFDAIIAWNSFFHLPATDQRAMFGVFEKYLNPERILMFTSGTKNGEAWGVNGGEDLYHASLDNKEYEQLLIAHNFKVLKHVVDDLDCGGATVWITVCCLITKWSVTPGAFRMCVMQ